MAPRKPLKSLYEISLASVANVTRKLCRDIERKYGGWTCHTSQDKLIDVKKYVSTAEPLFDDVFKAVFDFCLTKTRRRISYNGQPDNVVHNTYIIMELFICHRIKTLDLSQLEGCNNCFTDSTLWKNNLMKLNNVVELGIEKVRLTDEAFEAIGEVCTNLIRISITSDLHYASMASLLHILRCRELRNVNIVFIHWEKESEFDYVRMVLTELPKIEFFENFENWLKWKIDNYILINGPLMSLRRVTPIKCPLVGPLISLCPNLKEMLIIGADLVRGRERRDFKEGSRALEILAESSLQLETLHLYCFLYGPEMTSVITSRCANLTNLKLFEWEGISVNDIYTIGISCPQIEDLQICGSYGDGEDRFRNVKLPSSMTEEQTFLTSPSMFVHLKVLWLHSNVNWDQRILPLVLSHANDLRIISLMDIFQHTRTSQDMISELLDANALEAVESLSLVAESYGDESYSIQLPIHAVERLLDSCPNLRSLRLICPMKYETTQYFCHLKADMQRLNSDFSLKFSKETWDLDSLSDTSTPSSSFEMELSD